MIWFRFAHTLWFNFDVIFFFFFSFLFLLLQKHTEKVSKFAWEVVRCIQSKHKKWSQNFRLLLLLLLKLCIWAKATHRSILIFCLYRSPFCYFFSPSTIYSFDTHNANRKFIPRKKASRSMSLSACGRTKCPLACEWQSFDGILFVEMSNTKLFHTQILNQKRNNLITSLRTAIFDSVLNTGSSAHCELCEHYSFFFFKCTHIIQLAYDCCVFFFAFFASVLLSPLRQTYIRVQQRCVCTV